MADGGREEVATLGGGCFWCLEAVYQEVDGVRRVVSGYAGGDVANPTYRQVCGGGTGHAEVVQVHFDPEVISYRDILRIFFVIHDPTTPNRQGADVGTQYRSAVFWADDAQRADAEAVMEELRESGAFEGALVTELEPLERFWEAEDYHQDYYARNPAQAYCRIVIDPKLARFRKVFAERRRSHVS
jgi:peptide-methionine (S)-S-oxide reductase